MVHKENFDDDPDSRYSLQEYAKEKKGNQAIVEREKTEKQMKEESAKAYEEWLGQKEMKDQAVKYLGFIPPPVGGLAVNASVASTSILPLLDNLTRDSENGLNVVLNVGRALKKVDRSLMKEWINWCDEFLPVNYLTGTLNPPLPNIRISVYAILTSALGIFPTQGLRCPFNGILPDQRHISEIAAPRS